MYSSLEVGTMLQCMRTLLLPLQKFLMNTVISASLGTVTPQCSTHSEYTFIPGLQYSCVMFTVLRAAMHCCRFVENIPRHITPKSGFESFPEYTQCIQEGNVRLQATSDIPARAEIYVRHAKGDIQWSCFHPNGCTSGTLFSQ